MIDYEDMMWAFFGLACGIKLGIMLGELLSQRTRRGIVRYYTPAGGVFLANRMWY